MSSRKYNKNDFNVGKSLPVNTSEEYSEDNLEQVEEKKRFGLKKFLLTIFLILFVFALTIGIWNGINISRASSKMFGSGNLFELVSFSPLKKDISGRVNVLVVGYSVDNPGHQGANLTDSIIVLSMDRATETGYMLSIPRDLYLNIPGNGYGKINEVYKDGGMELLEKVLSDKLGIEVGYYVVVNYAAVRDTVNALDGITITVNSSDQRGLYDPNISPVDGGPLQLANGAQHLDGQTALNLTRARGSTYGSYGFPRSDLTRIEHQKQIFAAIKDKSSNIRIVLNPIKNSKLFDAAANNLKSNLEPGEAMPLYRLFASIPTAQLKSYGLNNINNTELLADFNGGLIPIEGLNDYSKIQEIIKNLK